MNDESSFFRSLISLCPHRLCRFLLTFISMSVDVPTGMCDSVCSVCANHDMETARHHSHVLSSSPEHSSNGAELQLKKGERESGW